MDIEVPLINKNYNSTIASKLSSPTNMRLSQQANKFFGPGENSPFGIKSLELCQQSTEKMMEGYASYMDD